MATPEESWSTKTILLHAPDNLPLHASAPRLCAGITLYFPLQHWSAGPGEKVAVVGLGGLGPMGVKLGHAMGAEVTVLSQSLRKKDDGIRMGASHYDASSDPGTLTKLERNFDLILNTVSSDINWNDYLKLLKVDGTMVVVGIPEKDIPVNAISIVMGRRSLSGSAIGGIRDSQETLDFLSLRDRHGFIERVIQP
jgi:uncharacterized zinc-type alcohol dehydrogenase-like protein